MVAWKPKKEVKEAQSLSRTVTTWDAFFSLLSSSLSLESAKELGATWHQSPLTMTFPNLLSWKTLRWGSSEERRPTGESLRGPCFSGSWSLLSLGWIAPKGGRYPLCGLILSSGPTPTHLTHPWHCGGASVGPVTGAPCHL